MADEQKFFRFWVPALNMWVISYKLYPDGAASWQLTERYEKAGIFPDPPGSLLAAMTMRFHPFEKQPAEFSEWVAQGNDGT